MKISIRDAFGKHLLKIGSKKKKIVVLSCDLKEATRTKFFFNQYPNRSFEIGISEANALGIAAGLSFSGFIPIISSFGSFITGKHLEIRTSISYNKAPVIIIGTHGGLIGADGATQSATQDISLMRSMPNFLVFQPCSPIETQKILNYAVNARKPVYIRISRNEVDEIYDYNYKFKIGECNRIISGKSLAIISSGAILHNCLEAIKKGNLKNIALFNAPTLKPFHQKKFIKKMKNFKKILVVEDHTKFGGLTSVISETLSLNNIYKNISSLAIDDCFIESGKVSDLEKKYKLSSAHILKKIKELTN